jgi:hypothetical protein
MQEFENNFITVLEKVEATTNLFPKDLVTRDECGIARTIRRTLTALAQNMGISTELLKATNMWRSEFG